MEEDFVKHVEHLVIQLAVILVAAKIAGEICDRYLKIPTVLGELGAGTLIGPFALGGIAFFGLGPLFPVINGHDTLRFPWNYSPYRRLRLWSFSSPPGWKRT